MKEFFDSLLAVWLAGINIYLFFLCLYDKRISKTKKRRVPERRFFTLSALGGACGMLCGMLLFRHKTKHLSFCVLIPTFFFIWLAVLGYFM